MNMAQLKDVKKNINVDSILSEHVGPIGVWQMVVLFTNYITFPPAIFAGIILSSKPKYRCKLEKNSEGKLQSFNFSHAASIVGPWWDLDKLKPSVHDPWKNKYGCYRYSIMGNDTSPVLKCDNGYEYEENSNHYPEPITITWDLVCDQSWLVPFSTTIFMFGMMLGFLTGGTIGGVYGRRTTIIFMTFLTIVSANLTSFSPNYTVYIFLRALTAMGTTARATCLSVLVSELTLANDRSLYVSIYHLIGGCLLKLLVILFAYLLPSWRLFLSSVAGIYILAAISVFTTPESPRWLFSQKRPNEALLILYRGYKINQKPKIESEAFFSEQKLSYEKYLKNASLYRKILSKMGIFPNGKFDEVEGGTRPYIHMIVIRGIISMFKTKELTKTTLISTLIFANQIVLSFGITFYTRIIEGSIYLTTALNALMTIPMQILTFTLYRCFKSRKLPLMGLHAICFLALFSTGIYILCFQPASSIFLLCVFNLAFVFMGATLGMTYILVPEMFASDLRTQGLGIASGFGRVSGLISDFINELDIIFMRGTALIVYSAIILSQLIFIGHFLKDITGENLKDNSVNPAEKITKSCHNSVTLPSDKDMTSYETRINDDSIITNL